jgi:hypothetical protein
MPLPGSLMWGASTLTQWPCQLPESVSFLLILKMVDDGESAEIVMFASDFKAGRRADRPSRHCRPLGGK